MCPKLIFLFNSVLNMKQTKAALKFLLLLALAAWWCRAHHSLRIVAQLGSFSQPERTLLIISAGLLWNANIYAPTEPSPSAWLRSSSLPKGCWNRRWEVFALNRRREPKSKSPLYQPSSSLFWHSHRSKTIKFLAHRVQSRRRLTGVESEPIKLDKASGQLIGRRTARFIMSKPREES